MRKSIFPAACAAILAACMTQSAEANVFAAELSAADAGANFDISFRLNEDATAGVTVNVYDSGSTLVKSINAGNLSAGPNTVQWDKTDNSSAAVPSGDYTFEVEAAATGYAGWTELSDVGANEAINFYSPKGVAINKDTASPLFGRIYVAENAGDIAAAGVRDTTEDGIFVLSNDLTDITNQGTVGYGGATIDPGLTTTSTPADVALADGKLYLAGWSDSLPGIWVMDEANLSAAPTQLFDGTPDSAGIRNNGTDDFSGSIYGISIEGTGSSLSIYTMDEDITVAGAPPGSILRYDVGTATSGYTTVPTVVWDRSTSSYGVAGGLYRPVPDGAGGYWFNQYRFTQSAGTPNVLHINSGGTVDFESATDLAGGATRASRMDAHTGAGMAMSNDGNTLYVTSWGSFGVFDISGGPASPAFVEEIALSGNTSRDLEVGPAGNVYIPSSSSEGLHVFSPAGANSFTTASPAGVTMTVVSSVDEWTQY